MSHEHVLQMASSRQGSGRRGQGVVELAAIMGNQAGTVLLGRISNRGRSQLAGSIGLPAPHKAGCLVEPDERRIKILGRLVEGQGALLGVVGFGVQTEIGVGVADRKPELPFGKAKRGIVNFASWQLPEQYFGLTDQRAGFGISTAQPGQGASGNNVSTHP